MNNPISIVLLLVATALGAMLVVQMEQDTGTIDSDPDTSQEMQSAARPARTLTTREPPLPPRESLTATVTRPLFNPSRSPAEGSQVVSDPAQSTGGPVPQFELTAIVIDTGVKMALGHNPVDGEIARLQEGDVVAGWQLEEIHSSRIVLSRGDDTTTIELRRFEQKPSPAQSQDNMKQPMMNPALRPMAPIRPMAPTNRGSASGQESGNPKK